MAMSVCIDHLETPEDIQALYGLMKDLRPHLQDESEFVERVQRQRENGYRLLCAWAGEHVVGAAGYRLLENLLYGPYLYIDDLVILKKYRRNGTARSLSMRRSCTRKSMAADISCSTREYT